MQIVITIDGGKTDGLPPGLHKHNRLSMSVNDNKTAKGKNGQMPFGPFDALYYHVIRFFIRLLSLLPFGVLYALSDLLFYPFYYVIRYRRRIVRSNLTSSFPDKSLDEIIRIEKQFYHFFIDMSLETCKLISISPEEMKRRMKFGNIELPNGWLAEGNSVSFFLGHFGNWEWISTIGLWLDDGALKAQIYRRLHSKAMDRIMMQLRERAGNVCVEMRQTVRFMSDSAKSNTPCLIGFIADQSPNYRDSKYFIPFLNHNTPVLTGTEKATKHFDYKALFISIRRVKRGYYECELSSLHDNPKSLPDFELTNMYFRRLEQEIARSPELYLWTHNRFKHALPIEGRQA